MIDLVELFTELQVPHWTSGKNVSLGWIGIRCIYCNDKSNHLGVNIETGKYKCWKCPAEGWLDYLLVDLINVSHREALAIVNRHKTETFKRKEVKAPKPSSLLLDMPYSSTLPKIHREYLASRRYSPLATQRKYGLLATGPTGEWSFRIIIPVYMDHKMVNFTAMAIAGQDPKYKHCPNPKALIDMESCLYGIDQVQDKIIVVEGALDQWRLGDGAAATFGTMISDEQVDLIIKKRIKEIYVFLDSDAEKITRQFSRRVAIFSPKVVTISVKKMGIKDPDSLSDSQALEIRRMCGLK
jgi:5S rRNA maturation endonuclease (ribonuclease M5)